MNAILGQNVSLSPEDVLASMPGTYAGPPLVLAPTDSPAAILGVPPPEPLVSTMPASVPGPLASFAPVPPPAARVAAPPPPVARAAAAPPAAPQGPALAPGFGDFASTLRDVAREAARTARQPKLSEIGTIQENVATEREKLARGALERFGTETAAAEEAVKAAQAAESVSAAERAQLASERATAQRQAEEDAAIQREQRRQAFEDVSAKYQGAQDELENTKIDVNAAYGGAGQRILSAIAVAMGAFGASITGGPNYALQIVNDRINRELDAQRSELDKKKGKVSELGRLMQRNETLLGDATAARDLARAQTYKALADDVEARAKGRELTAQQAQVLAQLRTQESEARAKLEMQLAESTAGKLLVGAGERQAQRAAAAGEARRKQAIEEKRAEKSFESGLKIEEALGIEAGKKALVGAGAEQTSALASKLLEKDFPAAAGNYLDIASQIGIDPVTGKSTGADPSGLGLVNLGIVTKEGRINRQGVDALAERMAKSFGGVVTESDRDAARRLLKGAGDVESIQRGVFAYGQAIGRNMRTLEAGNPEAYRAVSERMPLLREAASIGQSADVQRAAGFKAVR